MGMTKQCCFCSTAIEDEIFMGKLYTSKNVTTHYYCLLLSTNTRQNGTDKQGIEGFLLNDIRSEVKRSRAVTCSYCKNKGASIYCAKSKCRRVFHLPCGRKKSTHHHFFGCYRSFCHKHRPVQKIPSEVRKNITGVVTCAVCYDNLSPKPSPETVWTPCCKAWYHKECLQKLACSAGYFFKCPLCNNKNEFEQEVKKCGVFIPERDAAWEMMPNAFVELLQRHDRCDAKICRAHSRYWNNKAKGWEIILCRYCGSQGIHRRCGNLKDKEPKWSCEICQSALGVDDESDEETDNIPAHHTPAPVELVHTTQDENVPQCNETTRLELESEPITYNLIADVEENMSVMLSSSDSDVEVVNYEPSIRSVDNHKYELKTRNGNYVEVVKLNESMESVAVVGDIQVPRSKKVILIDEDSDVVVVTEPESEYDY